MTDKFLHAGYSYEAEDLMTQAQARAEARRLNEDGLVPAELVAVAVPWPTTSWGGHEEGWTVCYVAKVR
jgi:hypothetical protein